ncbi:MAG: hypothetical protein JHC74_03315 [Thermoleophilia bacterium]|nr:hypothetical protein [Thermoleophilia bacterium]
MLGAAVAVPAFTLAASPALADPLGTQIQISSQGPVGDLGFDALNPDLAYNPNADQYLAVWEGDTATSTEDEIFARLLDGAGNPLGGIFRISSMGPDGAIAHDALAPAVAFNPTTNEYLVVWHGDDALDEREIYGQRVTAAGAEIGADDFRISDMGPDGDTAFSALSADIAVNAGTNEYLVVWEGSDDTGALVFNEWEIYAQRLDASGAEIGANDARISDAGVDGNPLRSGFDPAVAYNAVAGQYLVVWEADEISDNENEIHGQRLGAGGGQTGANDFRISDMGPDGNAAFDAVDPAVAYNSAADEYLVAWEGDDGTAPLVDDEFEIFGQRLGGAGADERGVNDLRISDMGPDGNAAFDAAEPEVAANPRAGEMMVTWEGDDDTAPMVDEKDEVHGQRLGAAGAQIGTNDFRISVSETAANTDTGANPSTPVAYNAQRNEYLTAWPADSDVAPRVEGESEISVRRSSAGAVTAPPPAICATAPAPPTPSAPGTVTLSVAQLQINQRIYSAAIKRAEAINAWLDAGVEARDLCAGGLLATSFHSGITTAPGANGPLDAAAAPDPRPITPEPLATKTGVTFTLSTGQLRINQRIAARGVREANALQERLAAGLSGGDVDDGAVTGGKISTSVVITGATAASALPARTTTVVKPAAPKTGVVFTLSASQLAIDQRIGQAAIRRLNASRDALLTGIAAAELKPATITAADLAPGVAP